MDYFTGIVSFLVLWSVIFLCALPIGVKIRGAQDTGFADSAPTNPRVKIKFFYSFILSALIFIVMLIVSHIMGFSIRNCFL